MRRRWGDLDKTGPVKNALRTSRNGLKFYFTKPGHVVVPGLTGTLLYTFPRPCVTRTLDAHAHIIENGHKRQLELDGSASVDGALKLAFMLGPFFIVLSGA